MEKDYISTKCNELQENVERLERKKESLLKENERLKTDSKNRKSINLYSNSGAGSSHQLFGTGKSFLG